MRLCYALRRGIFFPSTRDEFGEMPLPPHRDRYLALVRSFGFDGVEVPGHDAGAATDRVPAERVVARELGAALRDAGLEPMCVRAGGPVAHPTQGAAARERVERAIRFAGWLGAGIVNLTFVTPPTHPAGPGVERRGETVSQGSSRLASEGDFERTAARLRRFGEQAGEHGIAIAVEVHQGSIADNAAATLHLLDLVDLPNVGANPDLGNIYWQYEEAEETAEAAILALAPRARYWHCKNLRRIHIPELQRAIFQRVPLPDGDIDYRFAVAAMHAAGYTGPLAVEGMREGDQLTADARGAAYARDLLAGLTPR